MPQCPHHVSSDTLCCNSLSDQPRRKDIFRPPQCRVRVSLPAALWSGPDAISNTTTIVSTVPNPSLLKYRPKGHNKYVPAGRRV